ncbi:MAG: type II secretion system F family protein, partial [Psychromonas sp.]
MEYLLGIINSYVNDSESAKFILYIAAAATGVTFSIALMFLFSGVYSPLKSELQKLNDNASSSEKASKNFNKSLEHSLEKLPFLQRQFSGDLKTKRLLIHAGFHSSNALKVYNALKLLLLLIAAGVAILASKFFPELSPIVST